MWDKFLLPYFAVLRKSNYIRLRAILLKFFIKFTNLVHVAYAINKPAPATIPSYSYQLLISYLEVTGIIVNSIKSH